MIKLQFIKIIINFYYFLFYTAVWCEKIMKSNVFFTKISANCNEYDSKNIIVKIKL